MYWLNKILFLKNIYKFLILNFYLNTNTWTKYFDNNFFKLKIYLYFEMSSPRGDYTSRAQITKIIIKNSVNKGELVLTNRVKRV